MTLQLALKKETGMLNLSKAAPNFKTLRGILNWNPDPVHGASLTEGFDLDIFAFQLSAGDKVTSNDDVIFYGNKGIGGAVSVPVDNRTGEGDDDEFIELKLNQVDAHIQAIDVYVFIYDAHARGQTFGMMADSNFVLHDVEGKKDIVKYALSDYTNETAIHVGRFKRNGSEWGFEPSGVSADADPNEVLATYA